MNTFKPEVPKTEIEKRRDELVKKHLWKSYRCISSKELYRCIDITHDEFGFWFRFETIYIESGDEAVKYGRSRLTESYFKSMLKPIKDKEFEGMRDKARVIISSGVLGG